jgi:hypothetical protein
VAVFVGARHNLTAVFAATAVFVGVFVVRGSAPVVVAARCQGRVLDGVIGRRWSELGGADGPLGCRTSRIVVTADGASRYVQFRHGQLIQASAPGVIDLGTVAVFTSGRCIDVDWDLDPRPGPARVVIDWLRNGRPPPVDGHVELDPGTPAAGVPLCGTSPGSETSTTGRWAIPADVASGVYSVRVSWCRPAAASCEEPPAVNATVLYEPAPMSGVANLYDAPLGGPDDIPTSAAEARSGLDRRRGWVLRDAACRPPRPSGDLDHDLLLAQVAAGTRGIDCPDRTAAQLIASVNGQLGAAEIPTDVQVGSDYLPLCPTQGNYDFALQLLTAIVGGYRDRLDPLVLRHVIDDLLVMHGPLDANQLRTVRLCGVSLPVETENHVLMIATAQYLANDLRRTVLGRDGAVLRTRTSLGSCQGGRRRCRGRSRRIRQRCGLSC